ncbi:MAG: hypothetical protein WA622_04885 [Mycobacterium sp.]|uniref:hypothetical protein n=1 Tax=Mycobacterium sp. TaxID=1785 RepID=UPI003BB50587
MAAANRPTPHEPRRAVAVIPHLASERRHIYHNAATLALLAGLLSAASGSLSPPATGDASTVDFGYGVTLTLAPGWTIENQGPHYANLDKKGNQDVGMDVSAGTANTRDINQEAAMLIGQDIKARGLINVKQQPQVQVQTLQAKNFQQSLPINYTADVQMGQRTAPAFGTWIELFNPSAQRAAFIDFYAISGGEFQASLPDAQSMVASML